MISQTARKSEGYRVPIRVICHGRPTLRAAVKCGWLPGARYTNLRDIVGFDEIGLIDIDWQYYDFRKHLDAVKATKPLLTIARDIEDKSQLKRVLDQANELALWTSRVVIVPKDPRLAPNLSELIPPNFLLGYSTPTRYGATVIPPSSFRSREVHLLGGRPDIQFSLAQFLNVYSLDCNRITLDAGYGDYFNGSGFKPHPNGGYYSCIKASLKEINRLWNTKNTRTSNASLRQVR